MTEPAARAAESKNQGGPPPRWLMKLATRIHVFLHELSDGRWFNTLNGDDVVFVTMTGAKSGRTLTIPLMYVPYRDGVCIVASQGGAPKNPVWYGNIVKHPEIDVTYRRKKMKLRARLATDEERPEIWAIADQHYAPFEEYRARTDRKIPIFVCEPRE